MLGQLGEAAKAFGTLVGAPFIGLAQFAQQGANKLIGQDEAAPAVNLPPALQMNQQPQPRLAQMAQPVKQQQSIIQPVIESAKKDVAGLLNLPQERQGEMDMSDLSIENIVKAAKAVHKDNPVLAQLAATQAVLESRLLGKPSGLAEKYNNLFGIKGKGSKGSVNLNTWEVLNGKKVRKKEPFAHNESLEDSFNQHARLLGYSRYKDVPKQQSLADAARAVHQAGYATDPRYADKLVQVYEKHLAQYFQ